MGPDSASVDCPEFITDTLDDGVGVVLEFSRPDGALLGVGCVDGRIVLWDVATSSVTRHLISHVATVLSLRSDRMSDRRGGEGPSVSHIHHGSLSIAGQEMERYCARPRLTGV